MRVFHGIHNISGMPSMHAAAQRQLGVHATSECLENPVFGYQPDRVYRKPRRRALRQVVSEYAARYDVFHFYFGESLAGDALSDIPALDGLGKKVVLHFCGCDVRDSKHVISTYPINACRNCWPMLCSRNRANALQMAAEHAFANIVSTPDLLEFVPRAQLVGQPFDIDAVARLRQSHYHRRRKQKSSFRVAHAPSSQAIKGSAAVQSAVRDLQADGRAVELINVENVPWRRALELYASADVAVDQLLIGAYGSVSVEMMALGVPVVCYLREELVAKYPERPPIVSATADNLANVLAYLMDTPRELQSLADAGLRYVKAHHDAPRIAEQLIHIYRDGSTTHGGGDAHRNDDR